MRLFRSLAEAHGHFGPCALTIGNFDGVHAGHQAIVHRVVATARAHGWQAAALTFEPHPLMIVAPDRAPATLTTPEQRCHLMAQAGLDQALILPFTRELSKVEAVDFVRHILVEALHVRSILVGENFRFGHRHAGNTTLLRVLGRELGFGVETLEMVTIRHRVCSSTGVRDLIAAGNVRWANRLLARPFSLAGPVVTGQGIGRSQTVPTLNLAPETEVLPAPGVYVTTTADSGSQRRWRSVTNVGYRPTFGGEHLTIESFLLGAFDGEAPERIRVDFHYRLRPERKFTTAEGLRAQILEDARRAAAWHRRYARWVEEPADLTGSAPGLRGE